MSFDINGTVPVAQEIAYLAQLAGAPCTEFKHFIRGSKYTLTNSLADQTVLTFTVPDACCWIVTFIGQRSVPAYNDAELAGALGVGGGGGDWRSGDIDAGGDAKLWLEVNAINIFSEVTTYFALTNRPVLFVFQAGDTITMVANRDSTVPDSLTLLTSINGYLAPLGVYGMLSHYVTQIISAFA